MGMESLRDLFEQIMRFLKGDDIIVLTTKINQYGDEIPDQYLEIRDGRIYLVGINCYSSSWLGLGTCLCGSHDPRWSKEITVKEMVEHLKEWIINRLKEIERLEENKETIERLRADLEKVFSNYLK